MELTIQGLKTYIEDTGAGDRGTVLFLNGWNTRTSRYSRIFALLASLGWRVVGFDMPGVGRTDEPPQALTIADYAAFTLELCERLGLRDVVLFGHSHGGRLALWLLEQEDCPLRCEKAVLMDAAGVRFPLSGRKKAAQALYKGLKFLGTNPVTRPLFADLYAEQRDRRASADYKAATPVMRQTMQNVLPLDLRPRMGAIRASTLLIWGDRDADTTLEAGREMEKRIPGAGLAVIRNAGHFCFEDNWPQFEAVIRAFF